MHAKKLPLVLEMGWFEELHKQTMASFPIVIQRKLLRISITANSSHLLWILVNHSFQLMMAVTLVVPSVVKTMLQSLFH